MTDKNEDEPYRIPDSVWKQIEPLLPPEFSKPRGGRPRINDRKVMEAILCIFRAGWDWKSLPSSLGAPGTVRHRFKEWQNSGVFQRMWLAGLLTHDEMRALVWYGKRRELYHEE